MVKLINGILKRFEMKSLQLLFFAVFLLSCSAKVLITNDFNPDPFILPLAKTAGTLEVKRFETGRNLSREVLVMDEGRSDVMHYSTHSAYLLVKNGKNYLIDTGLGLKAREQFMEFPAYARPFFDFEQTKSVKEQIGDLPIEAIFFTHLHFDHASGAEDFGPVVIHTLKSEYENMKKDTKMVFIKSQLDADFLKWDFLDLETKSYGPFEKSLDFFGDGSLIIVTLSGHTEGSLGYVMNTDNGRFFLVGDAVWTIDQVISDKDKNFLARKLVDNHTERTRKTVELLHKIWMSNANLKVVPNHDLKANMVIPKF